MGVGEECGPQERERARKKFELEIEKVHKAYEDLVKSSQKRERLEAALKSKLEEEVRKKDAQMGRVEQLQKAFTSLQTTSERREEKEKQLRSRLERELETYKSQEKWEQRCVEMQGVQHMEETSGPHDLQLAALEKSSAETEKLIDEAKTEKLRHMEELYQSNRRVAELEAKYVWVKWLQTQLTEKEAMSKSDTEDETRLWQV
nr:hypothetical protein BaRGS_032758 [Batillaria attramentaria]